MSAARRSDRLRPVGGLRPDELGLPASKARELLLAHAWRRVAGEGIARRTTATAIRRGVLEIAVPDARWAEALIEAVPRLAGRLAAAHPELRVSKVRVRTPGDAKAMRALELDTRPAPDESGRVASSPDPRPPEPPELPLEQRLEATRELYLRRRGPRRHGDPSR